MRKKYSFLIIVLVLMGLLLELCDSSSPFVRSGSGFTSLAKVSDLADEEGAPDDTDDSMVEISVHSAVPKVRDLPCLTFSKPQYVLSEVIKPEDSDLENLLRPPIA